MTEYAAYSAVLPAENVGDLTPIEAADWALQYEQFLADSSWYRLFATEAWTLAGDQERALAIWPTGGRCKVCANTQNSRNSG